MSTAIEFRHIRKVYGNTVIIPDLNLKIEEENLLHLSVHPDAERQRPLR